MSPRILIWHSGVFGMSAVFVGLLILATQPDQPVTEKIAPTETEQTVEALPAISKAEANPDANARLATMPVAVSMLAPDADTPRPSLRDVSDDVPLPVPLTIPELPEPRPKLAVFLVTDTPDAKEWQRREQPRLERTGWTFGSRNLVRYVDGSVTASRFSISPDPQRPTYLIVRDDQVKAVHSGYLTASEFADWVNSEGRQPVASRPSHFTSVQSAVGASVWSTDRIYRPCRPVWRPVPRYRWR